jgi:hypothetical protein
MREGMIVIYWTVDREQMRIEIEGGDMLLKEGLCVLLSAYRHMAAQVLDSHEYNVPDCAFTIAHCDMLKAVGCHSLHDDARTWSYEPPVLPGNRGRDPHDLVR